jgi:hypothetical protein
MRISRIIFLAALFVCMGCAGYRNFFYDSGAEPRGGARNGYGWRAAAYRKTAERAESEALREEYERKAAEDRELTPGAAVKALNPALRDPYVRLRGLNSSVQAGALFTRP